MNQEQVDLSLYGVLYELVPAEASFDTLTWAVQKIREAAPQRPIWQEIDNRVITPSDISSLIKSGWRIEHIAATSPGFGLIPSLARKEIWLSATAAGYKRDIALFHELGHLVFPYEELADCYEDEGQIDLKQNSIIVEWLGRQLRINPSLLKSAVYGFSLKPYIYDRTSFLAFSDEPYHLDLQLPLPGFENYVENLTLKQTFMD